MPDQKAPVNIENILEGLQKAQNNQGSDDTPTEFPRDHYYADNNDDSTLPDFNPDDYKHKDELTDACQASNYSCNMVIQTPQNSNEDANGEWTIFWTEEQQKQLHALCAEQIDKTLNDMEYTSIDIINSNINNIIAQATTLAPVCGAKTPEDMSMILTTLLRSFMMLQIMNDKNK